MKEREFRIVPSGEVLDPGKQYYIDSWRVLSDKILDTYGKKLLNMSKMYKDGELVNIDLIILEEYPVGEAPGSIRHSFYVSEDLMYTYVF